VLVNRERERNDRWMFDPGRVPCMPALFLEIAGRFGLAAIAAIRVAQSTSEHFMFKARG